MLDSVDSRLRTVVIERFQAQEDSYVAPEEKTSIDMFNKSIEKDTEIIAIKESESKDLEAKKAKRQAEEDFLSNTQWKKGIEPLLKSIKNDKIAIDNIVFLNRYELQEDGHFAKPDRTKEIEKYSESIKQKEQQLLSLLNQVLSEGKPVPANVLAGYPELQDKYCCN